jgi:hypothetical protein
VTERRAFGLLLPLIAMRSYFFMRRPTMIATS